MAFPETLARSFLRWLGRGLLIVLAVLVGLVAFRVAILRPWTWHGRSKSLECRTYLRTLKITEGAYFTEKHRFTTHLGDMGFVPERNNHYAYFLSRTGPVEDRSRATSPNPYDLHRGVGVDVFKYGGDKGVRIDQVPMSFRGIPVGISGDCPRCDVLAVCAAQLDGDPALDLWTISSADRVGPHGEPIPAWESFHELDDESAQTMPPLPPAVASQDD